MRPILQKQDVEGLTIVRCTRKRLVEGECARRLEVELDALVDGPRKILLNLGNVKVITSSVLASLIRTHKRLRAEKGKLRLCCIHPHIREVFKASKLDQFFDIYEDEQAAMEGF